MRVLITTFGLLVAAGLLAGCEDADHPDRPHAYTYSYSYTLEPYPWGYEDPYYWHRDRE
jgi:hypothetical protein